MLESPHPPSNTLIVRSNRIRMALRLLLGAAGLGFGMYMFFGPGPILMWIAIGIAALCAGCLALGVMSDTPRLVIRPEGFDFHPLHRVDSYSWGDIEGGFAVVRVGILKMIAFNLTSEFKSRMTKKLSRPRFAGREAAVVGEFDQSAERITEILNERRAAWLSMQTGQPVSPDWLAVRQPDVAAAARPAGNGSPVLRAVSGILAVAFACGSAVMFQDDKIAWSVKAGIPAMAIMFGVFAIRGLRGLPSWLTKPPMSP
jgi:hypothetical protein